MTKSKQPEEPYFMHLYDVDSHEANETEFIIRGHVEPDEADEIFKAAIEHDCDEDDPDCVCTCVPEIGPWEKKYARWSMEATMSMGNTHIIRKYKNPGRGRFPITIAEEASLIAYRKEWAEQTRKTHEMFLEQWPYLKVESVYGDRVRFSGEGMHYRGTWDYPNEQVMILEVDLEAFNLLKDAYKAKLAGSVKLAKHDDSFSIEDYKKLLEEYVPAQTQEEADAEFDRLELVRHMASLQQQEFLHKMQAINRHFEEHLLDLKDDTE